MHDPTLPPTPDRAQLSRRLRRGSLSRALDSDPNENPDAKRFQNLDYLDALNRRLGVMDSTAVSLCMENGLPIIVFNIFQAGSMSRILKGEALGTIITGRD